MMNEALPMLLAQSEIAAARLAAEAEHSAPAAASHNALLYLDGVTVSFDGFKALNGLSLIVEKGELRTIIGPNGAGKTTMMDVITGMTRPDSGQVFFAGSTDLSKLEEVAIANLGIGR
jgi:urea transport system ATP-binding protein